MKSCFWMPWGVDYCCFCVDVSWKMSMNFLGYLWGTICHPSSQKMSFVPNLSNFGWNSTTNQLLNNLPTEKRFVICKLYSKIDPKLHFKCRLQRLLIFLNDFFYALHKICLNYLMPKNNEFKRCKKCFCLHQFKPSDFEKLNHKDIKRFFPRYLLIERKKYLYQFMLDLLIYYSSM